jgi:hypothetical protein
MKTIIKLYESMRPTEHGKIAAKKAFQKDSEYFQNKFGLDKAISRGVDMTIEIPGYKIYYIAGINEFPHKIQGMRADTIEIIDNCVREDIINEVIAPMVHRGAELIFIDYGK